MASYPIGLQHVEIPSYHKLHLLLKELFQFWEVKNKHTVEAPIKDPPKKGQPLNNGHISGHQTYGCSVFLATEKGQPLCNRQNLCPQCAYYSEIPLY